MLHSKGKVAIFCFCVKYSITIFLLIISIVISKDAFDQYSSKAASFVQREMDINKEDIISLVVGFWPLKKIDYPSHTPYQSYEQWELGKDFTLLYGVRTYSTAKESIFLQEHGNLKINHSSVGKVTFEKLYTHWGYYYKISANIINIKSPYRAFVEIKLDNNLTDIPNVDVILTSETNSFGITMADWQDGTRILLNKLEGYMSVDLQPKKKIMMKTLSNCSNSGFYKCFHDEIIKQEFKECPRKCFSISTFLNATPICKTRGEFQCAHDLARKIKKKATCYPACTQVTFEIVSKYQDDVGKPGSKHNMIVAYKFINSKIKVEEEYLIHDFIGMLGSIGGTLGLFIGFSFLGGLFHMFNFMQDILKQFTKKEVKKGNEGKEIKSIKVIPKINSNSHERRSSFDHEILLKLEQIGTKFDDLKTSNSNETKRNDERFQEMEKKLTKMSKVIGIVEKRKNLK